MEKDPELFGSDWVQYSMNWDDSRRLNAMDGSMIVIASSGMCEAGRIRHHLRHAVENPDNAIVIVSYQATPVPPSAGSQNSAVSRAPMMPPMQCTPKTSRESS